MNQLLQTIVSDFQAKINAPTVTTDEQRKMLIQLAIYQGYLIGLDTSGNTHLLENHPEIDDLVTQVARLVEEYQKAQ
jgi:hypothetical protein